MDISEKTRDLDISEKARKNFAKDMDIPIQVFRSPYFQHFMNRLDGYYDTWDKYGLFIDAINTYGSEDLLWSASHKIRDGMIDCIQELPTYSTFNALDLSKFKTIETVSDANLYHPDNNGKTFVSVDLAKANFQSFGFAIPGFWDSLGEIKTFDQLLMLFTSEPYFFASKKIRQVIFGNLNPKRQQTIQRHIMGLIFNSLLKDDIIKKANVRLASSDELIWEKEDNAQHQKNVVALVKEKAAEIGADVKVKTFCLKHIGTDKYKFYVKEYDAWKMEIKGVSGAYMAEVICFINAHGRSQYKSFLSGPNLIPTDRLYMNEDRLSSFIDPLF